MASMGVRHRGASDRIVEAIYYRPVLCFSVLAAVLVALGWGIESEQYFDAGFEFAWFIVVILVTSKLSLAHSTKQLPRYEFALVIAWILIAITSLFVAVMPLANLLWRISSPGLLFR